MTKGVLLFAKNNEKFDYIKQATACALSVEHHMGVPVTLVTVPGVDIPHDVFDQIVFVTFDDQKRKYNDSYLQYYNSARPLAYDISPYHETIILDTDYLVQSDSLNCVWGNIETLMMNNVCHNVNGSGIANNDERLSDIGPKIYWATVVYFKKSLFAKSFFDLVLHIQKNWDFYVRSYNLPDGLYRNDYAFTIAAHIISDRQKSIIPSIPTVLLNSFTEEILSVDKGSITLASDDIPIKISGQNVHLMNKFSLNDRLDEIIKVYS